MSFNSYSKALYELSIESNVTDEIEHQSKSILKALETIKEFNPQTQLTFKDEKERIDIFNPNIELLEPSNKDSYFEDIVMRYSIYTINRSDIILKEKLNFLKTIFDQVQPEIPFSNYYLEDKKINMSDEEKKLFGIEKLNIKRSDIPAVTHVDYSARIQTVHKDTNPKYYSLIKKFKEKTNCSVLINTSFNVRGEPIVSSPEDAFRCFMGTDLDVLVVENFILIKKDQNLN